MTRRKTPLLVSSEYVSPYPDFSLQLSETRLLLFETIKGIYPEMLRKLSDEVFPLFEKLVGSGLKFWGMWGPRFVSSYELLAIPDASARQRKRRNLKSALDAWADTFNVTERWAKDEAVRTLWRWHCDPEWRKSLRWNPSCVPSSYPPTGEPFEFGCEGWETKHLTWSSFSESVRRRFEEKLREYGKKTRWHAESYGLVRSRRKYSRANFEWFVRYQFAGRSSTEIAKEGYGDDPDSTVLKGIKAAAKLIGWDHLREPKVRRKRKIRKLSNLPLAAVRANALSCTHDREDRKTCS